MGENTLILKLPFHLVQQMSKMKSSEYLHQLGTSTSSHSGSNGIGIEVERLTDMDDIIKLTLSGLGMETVENVYRCEILSVSDIEESRNIVKAEDLNMHAEDLNTHAEDLNTHAEDLNTEGLNTHAEGLNTHAEDLNTHAEDLNTHAEDLNTHAEDLIMHAEDLNMQMNQSETITNTNCSDTQQEKWQLEVQDTLHHSNCEVNNEHNQYNMVTGTVLGGQAETSSDITDFHQVQMNSLSENIPKVEKLDLDCENLCSSPNQEPKDVGVKVEQEPLGEMKAVAEVDDIETSKRRMKSTIDGQNDEANNQDTAVNSDYFLAVRTSRDISDTAIKRLEKMALKCPLCKYAAVNIVTFKSHLKSRHNLSWKDYKASYIKHPRSDSVDHSDKCNISSETEKSDEILDRVENMQTFQRKKRADANQPRKKYDCDPQNKLFECELCGSRYKSKPSLTSHLYSKHATHSKLKSILQGLRNNSTGRRSSLQTKCPFCDEIFDGNRIFSHMKVTHVEEPNFDHVYKATSKVYNQATYERTRDDYTSDQTCPHCGIQLKKCSLKRHIESHCKKNLSMQQRFHCHLCAFYSTNREVMSSHKASEHQTRVEYICDVCGACYRTPVGLRQHARIKHHAVWKKPLQWWPCQQCDKQFSSKMNLDRHKPVHTREYQHSCPTCGKKFKDSSSLITHKRNIHDGNYRYHCQLCGHGVDRKKYLATHKCEKTKAISQKQQNAIVEDGNTGIEIRDGIPQPVEASSNIAMEVRETEREELTFVLHGDDSQVSFAMDKLGNVQTVHADDGSVITMDTTLANLAELGGDGESIMVVMDGNVELSGESGALAMNTTLSDGSTVILLPDSGLHQTEHIIMDTTEYVGT